MKKTVIIITVLIVLLLLKNHIYLNVNSFEKYCYYNEYKDYTLIVNFQKEKIKTDFVSFYNKVLLENIAKDYLGDISSDDSIVISLYDRGMIGVSQSGDDLHIKQPFLINETDSIRRLIKVPEEAIEATIDGFTAKLEYFITNRFKKENKMNYTQKGIFHAIGEFYKRVEIQGDFKGKVMRIIEIEK